MEHNAIRIISTPPGRLAPEEIRRQWIGTVIPLAEPTQGGFRVGHENGDGHHVNPRQAIDALRIISPEAADWWEDNIPIDAASDFIFHRDVCELVTIN